MNVVYKKDLATNKTNTPKKRQAQRMLDLTGLLLTSLFTPPPFYISQLANSRKSRNGIQLSQIQEELYSWNALDASRALARKRFFYNGKCSLDMQSPHFPLILIICFVSFVLQVILAIYAINFLYLLVNSNSFYWFQKKKKVCFRELVASFYEIDFSINSSSTTKAMQAERLQHEFEQRLHNAAMVIQRWIRKIWGEVSLRAKTKNKKKQ